MQKTILSLFTAILLLSFLNEEALGQNQEIITSLPNQHPFEVYHRRLLPELPIILSPESTSFNSTFSWSNTYNSKRDGYFVDAETRELTFKLARGITEDLTFVADVGARMHDGGITDSFIRSWDEGIGASVSRRDNRGKDRYVVEAHKKDGSTVKVDRKPFGLSDIRVGTRYSLIDDKEENLKLVLGTDLTLPSHLGSYGQDSIDLRYSLIISKQVERFTFFGNLGASIYGDQHEDGLDFDSGSLDAVVGALVALSTNWSFQINQMIETTDQRNIKRYPDWTSYLDLVLHYKIDSNLVASIGVRENPVNGQDSSDVTGILGISYYW